MHNILSLLAVAAFCAVWVVTEHFLPWVSWHAEAMAFLGAFLLAWMGVARSLASSRLIAIPAIALPFPVLGFIGMVQAVSGTLNFLGEVWTLWFYVALCVACIVLGYEFGSRGKYGTQGTSDEALISTLAWVLVGGASLSTAIALVQTFDVGDFAGWVTGEGPQRRPGANLSQPNHFAAFLVMGLAGLAYLYQLKKLGSASVAVAVVFLLIGLVVSESRSGALSLFLLASWLVFKRDRLPVKTSIWVVFLLLLGFLCLYWMWPAFWNKVWQIQSMTSINVTSSGRLDLWGQIIEVIVQRPWFGWGVLQVAEGQNAIAHRHVSVLSVTYSHNLVLDLAVWLGIPLTVLIVGLTGRWLWSRVKESRDLLSWYCLAVVLPVAVHSMLEFPFAYAYFLVPVMLALGALEASQGTQPVCRISAKVVASILFLVSVALVWSSVEYFEIEEDLRIARFESLRVGQTPADHVRPKMILLTQLGALVHSVRLIPKPGMSSEELDLIRRVALYYPWSATLSRHALALSLNGNPEEGERQLEVIRSMFGEGTYLRTKERLKEIQEGSMSDQEKSKPL